MHQRIARIVRLIHILGFVFFLGSISTFILISVLSSETTVANLAYGRKIISTGTQLLTIPGIWMLTISGMVVGFLQGALRERFLLWKMLLVALILGNTYLFIAPAVHSATELAAQSVEHGSLLAAYTTAYNQESVFGGINILLALMTAALGVRQIRSKGTTH